MNERTKLLAEQAEILITEVGAFHNTPAGAYRLKGEHLAKFTELIVRECIRLCDQVDIVGADECIDNIKQHFGVE